MDEAIALQRQGLDPQLPVFKAIGVTELALAAAGEIGFSEAVEQAKTATRNYAKRQMTWARRNMMSWDKPTEQFSESVIRSFFSFIRENG
jgi:tRNA dimethylallyltransferase